MRRAPLALALALLLALVVTLATRLPDLRAQSDTPLASWRCALVTCHILRAVAVPAAGDGWAVGDAGTILRLQGNDWLAVPSPTTFDLRGLFFTSPTNGWAVGGDAGDRVALRWDGTAWREVPIPVTPGEAPPAHPDAPIAVAQLGDEAWMVGQVGSVFQLLEGRWLWRGRVGSRDLNAITLIGPGEGWAVGGTHSSQSTASQGLRLLNGRWSEYEMPTVNGRQINFTDLAFINRDEGWAVGEYYEPTSNDFLGVIAHYTTAGGWQIEYTDTTSLVGLTMQSTGEGWAVGWRFSPGGPQAVYAHRQNGRWASANGPTAFALLDADVRANGTGWAVGYTGALLRLQNGQWSTTRVPSSGSLYAAAFDSGAGWAGGAGGTLLRYEDGAWTAATSPTRNTLYDMALMGTTGWAVGNQGTILRLDNGQWQTVSSPTSLPLRSLALSGPQDGWAVGAAGTLVRLEGGTWSNITPIVGVDLNGVALNSDEGWAVGDLRGAGYSALLHLVNGEWQSVVSPTAQKLNSVALVGATGWIVGANGVILHLVNGTWQEVASPTSASLYSVYAASPNSAWAVGSGGVILEFRDGAWTVIVGANSEPTRQALLKLAHAPDGMLWAVGTYGVILRGYQVTPRQFLPHLVRARSSAYPAPR